MRFSPRTSILAGMPRHLLEAKLAALQEAYLALSSGQQVVTASYTQGDGTKSVTYRQASLGDLVAAIKEVQAQLGIIHRGRRPMRPAYL